MTKTPILRIREFRDEVERILEFNPGLETTVGHITASFLHEYSELHRGENPDYDGFFQRYEDMLSQLWQRGSNERK